MRRRRFLESPLALLAADPVKGNDYPQVVPGYSIRFPRDHGSHPQYRTEWWYITGWVKDSAGADYGVQVTFFRNRPRVAETNFSRFAPRQLLFAHAAIADPRRGRLTHDQRAARAGFGLADAAEDTTSVWTGDWSLKLVDDRYEAHIVASDFAFDLLLAATQPVLLQGDAGFSRKGPNAQQASYYYSWPQLAITGRITVGGKVVDVTGSAWLDHEWSSEVLAKEAVGWDWVGINLNDGGAIMAFRIRSKTGTALWAGGTYRAGDGRGRTLAPGDIRFSAQRTWRSPRIGVDYPAAMTLEAGGMQYALQPLMEDQELDARASTGTVYWEGAVRALVEGREIGRGYLELTGYWRPLAL